MAQHSSYFHLHSNRFLHHEILAGPSVITDHWNKQCSVIIICSSQPFIDIRLPTYLHELTRKNLKSLGCSRFARRYSENRCLLSLPHPT